MVRSTRYACAFTFENDWSLAISFIQDMRMVTTRSGKGMSDVRQISLWYQAKVSMMTGIIIDYLW